MRKLILLLVILLCTSVFALDYVKPDSAEKANFLKLVPKTNYTVSFLKTDRTDIIDVQQVNCTLECTNLRSEGPYYYLDVMAPKAGKFEINILYSKSGVVERDIREVVASYDFVLVEGLIEEQRVYLEPSKMRFVVQNMSDSEVNIKIYSDLPDELLAPKDVVVKGKQKETVDLDFNPLYKGLYPITFKMQINDFKKDFDMKNIVAEYNLEHLFKSNELSFIVLSPTTNLYSSIRTLISYFK
jgi:hypothetical protein